MKRLLQDWMTDQAESRPWAAAVIGHGQRLTYGELTATSNRLARLLRAAGCRSGERVALLAPRSPMAIVGLAGIYKADAICVPLDVTSSASRIQRILESCHCHWLLTSGCAGLLHELSETRDGRRSLVIGSLDREIARSGDRAIGRSPDHQITRSPGAHAAVFTMDDVAAYSSEPIESRNDPDDPAEILFTSGSTGRPDGVVITHSNVMRFVEWAVRYFGMHPGDRIVSQSPWHVDLSLFDVFGAAAAGAELHLLPADAGSPRRLAEFIRGRELTHWCSAPSMLSAMAKANVLSPNDFPSLQRVIWAGDALPTPALMQWMQHVPHARFTNLYGQTETTIASSYYTLPACPADPQAAIPIGAPCAGEELLVLDEHMQPAAPGEAGDLYIAGAGLARGYWNDPDRTAAVFLHHPLRPSEWIYKTGDRARTEHDGLVYFLGPSETPTDRSRLRDAFAARIDPNAARTA